MRSKMLILAVTAAALSGAAQAVAGGRELAPRGDLVVTFSGTGGGGYRFYQPASETGPSSLACRAPGTTYSENDSYSWSYSFAVLPTGGGGATPLALTGTGLLSSSAQTGRCGTTPAATTTCTQSLRPPTPANDTDLDYPGVNVLVSGRQITVGALGELLRASAQPSCVGAGSLTPNLVQGYAELQASVTFPRALLSRPGGYRGTFTMSGAGLYAGVPLGGTCDSTSCDTSNCAQDLPDAPGAPSSCSFDESYSGTIEVRVTR
jgi:hypothetical protein